MTYARHDQSNAHRSSLLYQRHIAAAGLSLILKDNSRPQG
jgi:hypothetical protein